MGTKEKKYWFAFGVALGFATIAAALWWVRRQRRPQRQPLVLEIVSGQPTVAVPPPSRPSQARRTAFAAVSALLLMALIASTLLGLIRSTWAIDGRVDVSPQALVTVQMVRDELVQTGQAPQAAQWLDDALQPATYGGDVLIYLKEAAVALPQEAPEPRRILRALINGLEGAPSYSSSYTVP